MNAFWFITFPNEPDHSLHERMVDFETVTALAQGKINSQLCQMSRIYKMMLRYSELKANRFLRRFPQIYWAPEVDFRIPDLYFCTSTVRSSLHPANEWIAWWKTSSQNRIILSQMPPKNKKGYKLLHTGREFPLYYDEYAGFREVEWTAKDQSLTTPGSEPVNSKDQDQYSRNHLLRQQLGMGYTWKQEAHQYQVKWINETLSGYLQVDSNIQAVSRTYYDICLNDIKVGMITVMEFKIYLTIIPAEAEVADVFTLSPAELKNHASLDNIELIFTGSL